MVFVEDERVLISTSMDESVLDKNTLFERYTFQSWESIKANLFYDDWIELRDVFPEAVPCKLPKDKGTCHEIDLKPVSKDCSMEQWPLSCKQVLAIIYFLQTT